MVTYGVLILAIIISLMFGASMGLFISALMASTGDDEERKDK